MLILGDHSARTPKIDSTEALFATDHLIPECSLYDIAYDAYAVIVVSPIQKLSVHNTVQQANALR